MRCDATHTRNVMAFSIFLKINSVFYFQNLIHISNIEKYLKLYFKPGFDPLNDCSKNEKLFNSDAGQTAQRGGHHSREDEEPSEGKREQDGGHAEEDEPPAGGEHQESNSMVILNFCCNFSGLVCANYSDVFFKNRLGPS